MKGLGTGELTGELSGQLTGPKKGTVTRGNAFWQTPAIGMRPQVTCPCWECPLGQGSKHFSLSTATSRIRVLDQATQTLALTSSILKI